MCSVEEENCNDFSWPPSELCHSICKKQSDLDCESKSSQVLILNDRSLQMLLHHSRGSFSNDFGHATLTCPRAPGPLHRSGIKRAEGDRSCAASRSRPRDSAENGQTVLACSTVLISHGSPAQSLATHASPGEVDSVQILNLRVCGGPGTLHFSLTSCPADPADAADTCRHAWVARFEESFDLS